MRNRSRLSHSTVRHPRLCFAALGLLVAASVPPLATAAGNQPPGFVGAAGHYMAKSGVESGARVGEVRAIDPDAGDTVTYSVVAGDGFAVNGQSGALTTTRALSAADAEGATRAVTVSASDGTAAVQSTFTVHLVDAGSITNGVRRERYEGEGGLFVSNVTGSGKFRNRLPDSTVTLPTFDQNDDTRPYEFFGTRYTAWLIPRVTGAYRFAVAADKAGELRLAPMATAGSIMGTAPIAASPTGAGRYQWLASADSVSAPVQLVAGQAYLLDGASVKEYWGDKFAVAWWGPRMSSPEPGSAASLIPQRNLYMPGMLPVSSPTVPQNFVVESVANGNVTLSWSPAATTTASITYEVRRDGQTIGTVPGGNATPSFTDGNVTGTHDYSVVAMDGAGGVSAGATRAGVDSGATYNAVEEAIRTGNATLLSGPERAIDEARAAATAAKLARYDLLNAFWGGATAPPGMEFSTPQFHSQFNIDATARDRIFPILTASTRGYGGSVTACPQAGDCDRAMAIAGTTTGGTRVSAFGVTPFPGSGVENGGNTNWRVNLRQGLDRHLAWLITGDAATPPSAAWRIALIKAPGSATTVRTYLTDRGIGSDVTIITCTMATISTCLQGQDLVIAGADLSGSDADAVQAVDAAIGAALAAGTPLVFAREPDGDSRLEQRVLPRMSASVGSWTQGWWGRADYTTSGSIAAYLEAARSDTTYDGVIRVLDNLRNRAWDVDLSACSTTTCPGGSTAATYLNTEFYPGVNLVRSQLMTLEGAGVEMFATAPTQNRLLKLLVLLGDVYRRNVSFPVSTIRGPRQHRWFESLFADYARYSLRAHGPEQPDLGTFAKPIRADVPRFDSTVTRSTRTAEYSTATGLYAIPGRTITITRTDNSAASASISVNYLRDGTTQEMESYRRPKFLRHASVSLRAGRTYSYTSATGGPVYLSLSSTDTPQEVSLAFTNVGKHPYWDGSASGDGSTARFAQLMSDGDYSWVDYVTPGFEVHSRYSYFQETLGASRWTGPEALAEVTSKFFHQSIYNLVGSTGPGLSLSATLRDLCAQRGWTAENGMACDQTAFRVDSKMHFNADQANCGFGCSGNPYDAWWSFSVIGWGDLHEMGHNVAQTLELNPHIPNSSTEVVPNVVSTYGFSFWNRHNPSKQEAIGHPLEQQAMYRALNEAQRQADPVAHSQNLIWRAATAQDPAAQVGNNGLFRLQTYVQLVQQSGARTDMVFGNGGWDAYTLARHWQRLLWQARASDVTFDARKGRLGLGAYSRAEAASLSQNDTFLLATSWVTQRDQRSLLEMFGVTYSAKAAAQVAAWGVPAAPRVFYYWPTRVDGSAHWAMDAVGAMPIDGRTGGLPDRPVNFIYTAPDAGGGGRTFLSTGIPTSFRLAEPIVLYANTGAAGTVTFRENGQPIRGCTDITVGPRTFRQTSGNQTELEARCTWVPTAAGAASLTSVFTPTSPSKVGSTSAPLNVTVGGNAGAPSASAVTPSLVRVGERMTVAGTGLDRVNGVTLNGLRAAFTRVSATELLVTLPEVPAATVSGRLRIETSEGLVTFTDPVTVRRLVTQVAIDRRVATINPGQLLSLQVVVTPAGATNPIVRWSSSAPAIAAVDAEGRVTGLAAGTTTIRARSDDGLVSATSQVTVTATKVEPVTAMSAPVRSLTVGQGTSRAMPAPVLWPAEATNTSVSWTSLDPLVATVSAEGTATGRAFGTTTIRATSDDSGASVDYQVTVGLPVSNDNDANTISGLTAAMEYSVHNGRSGTWVAYTNASALPDLTGNVVLQVRRIGSTAPVSRLVFSDAQGHGSALLGHDPAATYLSDIPCVSPCGTGWASLGYDRSNDGSGALRLRRGSTTDFDTYAKGMGVHASSTLTYDLGGTYARFRARVGPDKRAVDASSGSVQFIVRGDGGSTLFTSSATTSASAPQSVDLDVRGVNTLTLVVNDGGNGNSNDLGNWAGAHLLPPVSGMTLDAAGKGVRVGQSVTFTPGVVAAPGVSTAVTWTSSDASVATVDSAGRVTGVAPGTARITATSAAAPSVTAQGTVRVAAPTVWSIALDRATAGVAPGSTTTLVADVRADTGAAAPVWSSSDAAVATVNQQGVVTGVAPGNATITLATGGGSHAARARVTVGSGRIPVTGLGVDRPTLALAAGATGQITASVAPGGATDRRVAWVSSNALVATVSASGLVTGVRPGSVMVSARSIDGGFVARTQVTVSEVVVPVTGVTLATSQLDLTEGRTADLVATVLPAGATNRALRWSSSNVAVATVSPAGRVTATGRGTATIRVVTLDGARTATTSVRVVAAAARAIPPTAGHSLPSTGHAVAARAGMAVPEGAAVALSVPRAQSGTCVVRAARLVATGRGLCRVTVTVRTRADTSRKTVVVRMGPAARPGGAARAHG